MSREETYQEFAGRFLTEDVRVASEDEVRYAELDLETLLPTAYCDFVLRHGGGRTPGILSLVASADDHVPDVERIATPDGCIDLTRAFWREGMSSSLIAFARDTLGNAFCFERSWEGPRPAESSVWVYEHDFGEVSLVADSFEEWLRSYVQMP